MLTPAQIRNLRTLRLADYDVGAKLTAAERTLRVQVLRSVECRLAREAAVYTAGSTPSRPGGSGRAASARYASSLPGWAVKDSNLRPWIKSPLLYQLS